MTDLQNLGVVVTRPAHQAESLCQRLEHLGACPIRLPALDIIRTQRADDAFKCIDEYDIVLFISANAVDFGLHLNPLTHWSDSILVGAVGKATQHALLKHGLKTDIVPSGSYNSEALLQTEALQQVRDKKIIIFRGEGGRELLADTLRERGATVDYAEVYKRIKPEIDLAPVIKLWQQAKVDIVTVTSDAVLDNLYRMFSQYGGEALKYLLRTPLLVISVRTQGKAQQLGFEQTALLAREASDDGIVQRLHEWQLARTATTHMKHKD